MSVEGRRVLVTGGGSGAGADLALGFARAGAAEVVICGRRVKALEAVRNEGIRCGRWHVWVCAPHNMPRLQRRVFQFKSVVSQLFERRIEIASGFLVLPAETAAFPDIGPAVATA